MPNTPTPKAQNLPKTPAHEQKSPAIKATAKAPTTKTPSTQASFTQATPIKYTPAFPHFPPQEIDWILQEIRAMLEGEKMLSMSGAVREFESAFAKYCHRAHGIITNSCTSALDLVLRHVCKDRSDEVIIPTQTFFANLSSIMHANATPICCDTDENFLLDFEDLKHRITSRTKAIVLVHFAGAITPHIFAIKELCQKWGITLIEDCSHAHGAYAIDAQGRKHMAGSLGDFACFSFFSTKIMTMGEGGVILCDREQDSLTLRALANRGLNPLAKTEEFIHYGENFRLTELQATLGLSQLRCLEDFLAHRNHIASIYKEELKGLESALRFQEVGEGFRHAYWRFLIFLKTHDAARIRALLAESNIIADAPYNPLLHKQPLFNAPPPSGICPQASALCTTHISLPIHQRIQPDDARFIAATLKQLLQEQK